MFTLMQYEEAVWYAPDYADNRNRPEAERFAVQLVPMSATEMRRLEESKGGKMTRGKVNFVRRHNVVRAEILKRCIKDVRNLTLEIMKDGRVRREEIRSPAALVDTVAPEALLAELLEGLQDQSLLADGIVGKFVSPSVSPTPKSQLGAGGAPGAGGESAPKSPSENAVPRVDATAPIQASASSGLQSSSDAPGPN